MTEKLLPCPFCGCDEIEALKHLDWVACKECGASLEDVEPSARELWNTRAGFNAPAPRPSTSEDDEDMAAVGRALMEAIEQARGADEWMKGWAPAQCPSEIVFDLLNRQNSPTESCMAALEWYADRKNWSIARWGDGTCTNNAIPGSNEEGSWACDCGDRARSAMNGAPPQQSAAIAAEPAPKMDKREFIQTISDADIRTAFERREYDLDSKRGYNDSRLPPFELNWNGSMYASGWVRDKFTDFAAGYREAAWHAYNADPLARNDRGSADNG